MTAVLAWAVVSAVSNSDEPWVWTLWGITVTVLMVHWVWERIHKFEERRRLKAAWARRDEEIRKRGETT